MGDRTCVNIHVRGLDLEWLIRKTQGGITDAHVEDFMNDTDTNETDWNEGQDLVWLCAYECNYGNWEELEELLKDEKIPYDKSWDAGGSYTAGNEFWRIMPDGPDQGLLVCDTIYESRTELADFLKDLRGLSGAEIVAAVQVKYAEVYPFEIVKLEDL